MLFVVALLIAACLLWMRNQPERLITFSDTSYSPGYYKVSGDNLVLFASPPSNPYATFGIQVRSLKGHTTRTLVPADPQLQFYRPILSRGMMIEPGPCLWSIAAGELYYAVEARSQYGISPNEGPDPPPGHYSTFLMASKGPTPAESREETRILISQAHLPVQAVQFREISLQGGSPREVVALRGENFIMIGNQVFWIRPQVEKTVQISRSRKPHGRNNWLETTAHSDLMLTSLTDGATRCIRHGIARNPGLRLMATGVVWAEFAPYPRKPNTFYARASDGSIHDLKTLSDARFPKPLLEFGGRIYWTDIRHEAEESAFQTSHEVLMSCNLDGSDAREILNKVDQRFLDSIMLSAYHGGLYCCLNELPMKDSDTPRGLLCRLFPEKYDPIEIVRKMPTGSDATALSDGGYLYFVWQEPHHSFSPPFRVTHTPALYRVPLDH